MSLRHPPSTSFFEFSRRERVVVLLGVVLGLVLCFSGMWMPLLITQQEQEREDLSAFQTELDDWVLRSQALQDSVDAARAARQQAYEQRRAYAQGQRKSWTDYSSKPINSWSRGSQPQEVMIDYSIPIAAAGSLDPNTADSSALKRLGVPAAIVRRWLKFRGKGGTFVRREDISKLYGLPDSTYQRILPYFAAGRDLESGFRQNRPRGEYIIEPVELNTATDEQLIKIRGIGKFYAKQILDYRDRLGGFITVEQVAETPRLKDSTFQVVREYLRVDSTERDKLAINQLNVQRIARHPYISYEKAKVLVAYRSHHGPYRRIEDLYKTIALDSALINRLSPYISYD